MSALEIGQRLYRYAPATTSVHLEVWQVEKLTRCGAWIRLPGPFGTERRWMNYPAGKQYAWATKLEAIESARIRNQKYAYRLREELEISQMRASKIQQVRDELLRAEQATHNTKENV